MLANLPPMGWNSWNTFGHAINEKVVRDTADAIVDLGLKEHTCYYYRVCAVNRKGQKSDMSREFSAYTREPW